MRKIFLRAGVSVCAAWGIACAALHTAAAQQITLDKEDIPHLPTDTLPTDREDVRIVTFSDGTFRFIPTNPFHARAEEAYHANWDTVNLFAYRQIELADLPETVSLELVNSAAPHFRVPATGKILSEYGRRGRRDHNGVDIKVTHGQPVFAAFDGIVRYSRWNGGGFGNLVIIRHSNGLETYYAHLSRRAVEADRWVRAGQVIGYGGRTGRTSGVHLHFETRYADQSFDPERLVNFETGELRRTTFALKKDYFSIRSRAIEGIEEDDEVLAGVSDSTTLASTSTASVSGDSSNDSSNDSSAGSQAAGAATPEAATSKPATPSPVYHTIVSGDTLLAIARHYGTTTTDICRLNGITRNGILKIGRKLRIK